MTKEEINKILDKIKERPLTEKERTTLCKMILEEYKKKNTAKWVGVNYDGYADGQPVFDIFECSNCKEEYYTDDEKMLPNYCPNCGRKMIKE